MVNSVYRFIPDRQLLYVPYWKASFVSLDCVCVRDDDDDESGGGIRRLAASSQVSVSVQGDCDAAFWYEDKSCTKSAVVTRTGAVGNVSGTGDGRRAKGVVVLLLVLLRWSFFAVWVARRTLLFCFTVGNWVVVVVAEEEMVKLARV